MISQAFNTGCVGKRGVRRLGGKCAKCGLCPGSQEARTEMGKCIPRWRCQLCCGLRNQPSLPITTCCTIPLHGAQSRYSPAEQDLFSRVETEEEESRDGACAASERCLPRRCGIGVPQERAIAEPEPDCAVFHVIAGGHWRAWYARMPTATANSADRSVTCPPPTFGRLSRDTDLQHSLTVTLRPDKISLTRQHVQSIVLCCTSGARDGCPSVSSVCSTAN